MPWMRGADAGDLFGIAGEREPVADLGADETVLIPTSDDLDQVKRAADIIG